MREALFFLAPSVGLVLIGHFMMKWRAGHHTIATLDNQFEQALQYFSDPWICFAYFCGLASSVFWLQVLQRIPLSTAFPIYQGALFVLICLGSWYFFGEAFNTQKVIGIIMIFAGLFFVVRQA
jgi:multidrug transporter EmrE-like cation transporter